MDNIDKLRRRRSPLDKYSDCPNCHFNWDGGNMLETLSKLDIFSGKSITELRQIASTYGWTPENQARFSNVIIITLGVAPLVPEEITFYQCPGCKYIFEPITGRDYSSLTQAKFDMIHGKDSEQLHDNSKE